MAPTTTTGAPTSSPISTSGRTTPAPCTRDTAATPRASAPQPSPSIPLTVPSSSRTTGAPCAASTSASACDMTARCCPIRRSPIPCSPPPLRFLRTTTTSARASALPWRSPQTAKPPCAAATASTTDASATPPSLPPSPTPEPQQRSAATVTKPVTCLPLIA